jgi:hypothetical protein
MKRHLIKLMTGLILMVIVGALVFTGCAEEEEPPPPPPPPVEEEEEPPPPPPPPPPAAFDWPRQFVINSHGVGASDYAQLTSIAPLIEQGTGMKVRIVPEEGMAQKARYLKQGVFDAMTESASSIGAYLIEADDEYATREGGPFQIRGFAQQLLQSFGVMVRGDSEIRTIYDIKPGTKIAVWAMPGGVGIVKSLLAWIQLDEDDVVWVETGSYPDNMRMVADGRADVSVLALPSSTVVQELEAGPHGLHWLDLNSKEDPEGAARWNTILPTHIFSPISIGVPSSIGHWGWGGPSLFWTRADVETELIYNLVKWLDENFDSYKDLHPNNLDMSLDRFRAGLDYTYLPIHEGAIMYLKEKGMWSAEDDARQAANVDLVTRYIEAYAEAIDMADSKGIDVDPGNEEWMELWLNYKEELGIPNFKVILE